MYESEEGESEDDEDFDQSEGNSHTTSELSEYKMDEEMKGFYKHENLDPVRSSIAS